MAAGILLVGGGGHCVSCIDVIESTGLWSVAGIVDLPGAAASAMGYPILGSDEDLPALAADCRNALVTIGQIESPAPRVRLFELLRRIGFELPPVVSGFSRVSRTAKVGKGSVIMHGAIVNAGASIGENCIVNTHALIEHDTVVGSHCHISTAAVVNGGCTIGDGCFIGSGAVVRNGVTIAPFCVVGIGSVVVRDLDEPGAYWGCPAERKR